MRRMLDNLVAHADVASLYIVLHILVHGRPIETAGEEFGGPVSPKMPRIGSVVVFCNESCPKSRVLWNEQARSFKEHKVIF